MAVGVYVTGHVRSGTSLTAGILQAHGVFFGECGGVARGNPTGRVEHVWLKRKLHNGERPTLSQFLAQLGREGWNGEQPWGCKFMPKWWRECIEAWEPDVIVRCYRDPDDIIASAHRMGWRDRGALTVHDRWHAMKAMDAPTVVDVQTARLAGKRPTELPRAIRALGLTWSQSVCDAVIVPGAFTNPKEKG